MKTQRIAALKRTALFGDLSEKELAWIAERSREAHLKKKEMLFVLGEEAKGLFVIVQGKIRVFQHNAEGREQVMYVDTAGAVIGEVPIFDDGPYPASAISEEATDLLVIEKSDVHQFTIEHPFFALKALKLMAGKVRKYAELVEILSFHEVGQRLALFLLAEAQRAGKGNCDRPMFHLFLSNHEIAIRIGSVRDVVSRALARLQHDRFIAVEGRGITILDIAALKLYAEGGHSNHLDAAVC